MADIGPLCFQQDTPIQEFEIDKAAAVESASSFSTYLSLSDPPSTATVSSSGVAVAEVTRAPAAEGTGNGANSMFATNTRGMFGQVLVPSSSTGGGRQSYALGGEGWMTGLVIGVAGVLIDVVG